jgi:hypothetical protein
VSISIQAGTSSPPAAVASSGASGGTDLQRAYQAATKDLREAQQKLTKDTAAKANEDTIKADQLAVQLAQAAVARAAAAIAMANGDARQNTSDAQRPATVTTTTCSASDPKSLVDLYA